MDSIGARRATFLTMLLFLAQPIHLGHWLSRISEVQIALDLSKSELAIALLGMPCGLLPSLYFAGRAVDRFGPRHSLLLVFPPMLVAGFLPGLATDMRTLFAALFLLGACVAFVEVSLNVFAAMTERCFGVRIMSRAHGFWSLGVALGSLVGIQLARAGLSAGAALMLSAAILLPLLQIVAASLPGKDSAPGDAPEHDDARGPVSRALLPIVIVVFGATIVEGAMNDWATVYMRETHWGGTYNDALALTVFTAMVTIGRFSGDAINRRLGAAALARICLGSAIAGIALLVTGHSVWMSFAGFALAGFGVSTIFPLGISASASLSRRGEARNVSVMTFGALSGFLIGPPMIGYVAEATSLKLALGLLLPTLVLSFVLAARLAPRPR